MGNAREQVIAVAAERLKQAAADQNVYISLARATRMTGPIIDVVTPLLLSGETIDRAGGADEPRCSSAEAPTPPLAPADEITLRAERFRRTVAQIGRAAALHDLSDVSLHSLPEDLRTVMAAYADCHLHLRRAAALLEAIAAQHPAQQRHRRQRGQIRKNNPPAVPVPGSMAATVA